MLKRWSIAGFEPLPLGYLSAVPFGRLMQASNHASDTKSERHGQFQEKEKKTPTTELNNLLSKVFFRPKITTGTVAVQYFEFMGHKTDTSIIHQAISILTQPFSTRYFSQTTVPEEIIKKFSR